MKETSQSPMGKFWQVHLERAYQLESDCKVVGAEGRKGALLRIQGCVGGGYCDVEWGGVLTRGNAGKKIEIK